MLQLYSFALEGRESQHIPERVSAADEADLQSVYPSVPWYAKREYTFIINKLSLLLAEYDPRWGCLRPPRRLSEIGITPYT